jgi:hypothetical protein
MGPIEVGMIKIYSGDNRHPVKLGMEVTAWLKQQDLTHDRDYTWSVDTKRNQVLLAFLDEDMEDQWATVIKLRWADAIQD